MVRHAQTKLDDSGPWSFVQLSNGDSEVGVQPHGPGKETQKVDDGPMVDVHAGSRNTWAVD